ncbi:DUF2312 domain-containing protein [Phyllobacterium zundukense]|uniref:GapR-like DNA-binding domain-containing protein n=1 Tax=Phyllobacterium zundukense TaxID=1867719 RepID=A0A2N9VW23_9HYPH|nr:GapR family DNA-binding domain-containing protein [Phyllobacterium zundukense]ATU91424.1 hypothetical protein BLM14_07105 [Phyllobacterium zundukense]PIO43691.1 hypothetical protein B5P45_17490 [Phyllobacterium zundukense]
MSAEAEIKQFINRVLRLKEEQDTLGEDIREVYAEAKGRGYDKTALGAVVALIRQRVKIGSDAFNEKDEMVNLYLSAYEGPAQFLGEVMGPHTPAPARARENIEEFPLRATDSKLIETVANGVQTEIGRKALNTAIDIMIEREEAEYVGPETGEITNSSATTNELDDDAVAAVMDKVRLANANGVEPSSSNPTNSERPAFLIKDQPAKTMRDYRPHCQNPEACSGSGLKHCYSCSKLMAVESEVV